MRKLALLTILAIGLAVGGCNTIAGAGRDVSAVGNAVTDTAHDASH